MSDFGFLDLWFSSSWLIGAACVLHLIIKYARKFVHVTVNCWFCNNNSRVALAKKNEWRCMHCDQFNGFDKDGNYSKEIPEQHNENLNHILSRSRISTKQSPAKSNGLCRICNANQELKIRQLAIYEPFREENYDQEIELFKQRLEKSYKLCSICEKTVQNTLELKRSLYAKTCDQTYYVNEDETNDFLVAKKSRTLICLGVLITSILMVSFWKDSIKIDFLYNDVLSNVRRVNPLFLSHNYESFINIFSIACITAFLKIRRPSGRILGFPLIFSALFFGLRDYLPVALKVSAIILFFGYLIATWWRRKAAYVRCKKLDDGYKKRFMDLDEEVKSAPNDILCQSSDVFFGSPLCGKFSSLTLGSSSTVASPRTVPYLLRPTKCIIQPPRLKLDESNRCESTRSSPSTSSGYESVSNFLKRSPDSISEFDSVSQIGNNSRNSSFELRNRIYQKVENPFERSADKRLCTFGIEQNAFSPYPNTRNQCPPPSEHYYGVSPAISPQQLQPQVPVSSVHSTVQIILCSMGFFVLGFCFQLLVKIVNERF